MSEENSKPTLEELIERNLALTEEIYKMTKSMKTYINLQKVMSVIYFLLIVVPIILGAIYLPPLLKGIFDQYKAVLGDNSSNIFSQDFLRVTNPSDPRNAESQMKNLMEN